MRRKLIGIGTVILVLVLLLTLAPSCGKEKGEVKTLKIGFHAPLSGPAAPWGAEYEEGVKWAVDDINAAGGIKVDGDTYMLEVVSCDTKYPGSVAAECAHYLVYDEGCKFVIGPIGTTDAVLPIYNENKVLCVSTSAEAPNPDWPYHVNGCLQVPAWLDTWYMLVAKHRPELKTVVVVNPDSAGGHDWMDASLVAAPKYGMTVVDTGFFDAAATDFYPLLTPIVASNPDAVEMGVAPAGQLGLMTKQIRELGYEGFILQPALAPIEQLKEIAGEENCWGIATDQADYTSPVFPQPLRDLYQRWLQKYAEPGETTMNVCVVHGYGQMGFIKTAIEEAGSIDVDEVIKAFEDPDFTFERYLNSPAKLSGLETFGIMRQFPMFIVYAEIWDAEVEIIDGADVEMP